MQSTTIDFKFHFVDEEGNESGFRSKKGSFDGETLVLDDTTIPIEAVIRAERRLNRLILLLLTEPDRAVPVVLAVRRGMKPLLSAIVTTSSARWADMHREHLQKEGRGGEFRTDTCPTCAATIDLSGHPPTPQLYCPYCDAIVTIGGSGPAEEPTYHHCDECGYFARPKPFTIFYFYFLLVVYGYRYRRTYMCNSCMRGEAWKMFAGNLIFILGVPVAMSQLVRAYFGGSTLSKSFGGLDGANALAKRGKTEKAAAVYNTIIERNGHAAGVHFNEGLSHAQAGRLEEAVGPLQDSLNDCSNYPRAYEALCACYERLGLAEERALLRAQWDEDEEAAA